jgi:hypothetical protein
MKRIRTSASPAAQSCLRSEEPQEQPRHRVIPKATDPSPCRDGMLIGWLRYNQAATVAIITVPSEPYAALSERSPSYYEPRHVRTKRREPKCPTKSTKTVSMPATSA